MKLPITGIKPILSILFSSIFFLGSIDTARILCIFTINFDSHQSVFQVIIEELAQRGHELVVITAQPRYGHLQNVTEIDIFNSSVGVWEKHYSKALFRHPSIAADPVTLFGKVIMPVMKETIEKEMQIPEVQELLKKKEQHFDIILMEACKEVNLIYATRFNAPVILISSFYGTEHNFATIGATLHPLLFPYFNTQSSAFHSIRESSETLYMYFWIRYFESQIEVIGDALIREQFGEKAPNFQELKKKVQMLFLNVHHIWDNNRPVPPSVIYMGALHLKKPKPIPHDLKSYLDSSKNGVVYVSLGSKLRFSDLPPQTLRIFFNVFSSIPYDVLIKWNGDELTDKAANLRLEQWLPQNDVLHHPNIKAFVTHGGLQSTDEAIAAKVPMLAVPVFGDQFNNANKYVKHGIGLTLNIDTLDENTLCDAILKIIEDNSFRVNIARLSRIMEEQRAGGLQQAMYWVEYTATHGAEHLRSPFANASLREYLLLDYLALVGFLLVTSVVVGWFLLRLLVLCLVKCLSAAIVWKCGVKSKSVASSSTLINSLPGPCHLKKTSLRCASHRRSHKESKKSS